MSGIVKVIRGSVVDMEFADNTVAKITPPILARYRICMSVKWVPATPLKSKLTGACRFSGEYYQPAIRFCSTECFSFGRYFTWIMDKENHLVFANKSLLEYFGLDAVAFGKKLNKVIPPSIASLILEKHAQVLKCNRQDQSIIKSLMADGKEHVYQVTLFPIHDVTPGIMVGGEALDITATYNARQREKKVNERLLYISKATSEAIWDWNNQILSSAQLYINHLTQDSDDFGEVKDKALEIVKLVIEEIRKLSRARVTPDLNEKGLVASIDELDNDLRFVKIFDIRFVHSKPTDIELMSQSKKVTLFRIIQEQTKNIVKYSKANNVEISLHCCSDQVRLQISDDGKGFNAQNTRRGLGLSNIYERTRLYNGKVLLSTAPGKGCSVIVNIPFESRNISLMRTRKLD